MSNEKKNDGGPAYPRPGANIINAEDYVTGNEGMSLRDHFAGLAMQGIMGNSDYAAAFATNEHAAEVIAKHAVMVADAMIKHLEQ